MTLLITVFAAIISTILWYVRSDNGLKLEILSLTYWGASLMWLVDAVFEYAEFGAEYFTPSAQDMINDAYLGFSAAALGLLIWLAVILIKDPRGVVRKRLRKAEQQ